MVGFYHWMNKNGYAISNQNDSNKKKRIDKLVESIEQELLPKVFQGTIISLLKNRRSFKPDFLYHIRSLYQLAENSKNLIIDRLSQEDIDQPAIDCHEGCYYCCSMKVTPTMPELFIILEHIQKTYSQAETVKLIKDLRLHKNKCNKIKTVKERIKVYCTFLKKGACSIQDVKPLSCYAYTSTDVDKCLEFLANPSIDIPSSICHHTPYHVVRKAILKSLFFAGFSDVTEELNSGMLRLLEGEYGEVSDQTQADKTDK